MRSIAVNTETYDIEMAPDRNVAMVVDKECVGQDCLLAIQMLRGEYPFDTNRGVPYMETMLQDKQPFEFEENLREELRSVPNVSEVVDFRLIQVSDIVEFATSVQTTYGPVSI